MHAQASVLILCTLALLCDARVTKRFDPNHQPYRFVPEENAHHRGVRAPPSTFTVTYNTGAPSNVRNAVDYVLNLLNSWIVFSSAVPIRVNFTWTDLGSTVLGSAGCAWTQQTINRPYPLYIALNNAYYAGSGAQSIDINAQFSSSTPWYIGTDGRPPISTYDFPTAFLHEMIHGLGFSTLYVALSTPPTGLYNANFPNTAQSSVFDNRLYYGNPATTALSTIARSNGQQGLLLTACTSQSLVFRTTSAGDVRMYSPATFVTGSSIAHLDLAYYGSSDSLMIPVLANGDAYHYPGVLTMNILSTIGYTLRSGALTVPPTTTIATVATTVTTGVPPATTPAPGTTIPPASTATTGTPAPTTPSPTTRTPSPTTPVPTTGTPAPATTGTINPTTTGTPAPPAPTTRQPTTASTTSGQTSLPTPTQILSIWDGTYAIDSSGCDTLTCCCLTGNAVVTYDTKSNLVTIRSPVIGALCSGTTVDLRFGLFGDSDQGGSMLWQGYTYSVSISRVPSVLTVRTTTACGVTATCTGGACLAPLVVASASLPALSLLAALIAGAVMLLV